MSMYSAGDSFRHIGNSTAKVFAALLCAALVSAVGAQDSPAGEAEADPPGRVGRLSELTGQVWLYSPSAGEWIEALRNRPITDGDRLSTEGAARAEMRIGSTTVRLDSGTELEVLKIDDTRIELQLHNGSMTVRLRNREGVDEFSVVTDEGRFRAQRTGRYRIDRIDETSHLTVTSGSALYEGPGSALTVHSGQRAEFWIDRGNVAQYTISEPKRDAFAAWSSARDRNDDRSASSRYVSPEMTGVEDLDRHGRWEQSEEYGALWTPRNVPVGWAPYSTGHWVWIHPWGWTWVDDAPWGFAPFHYGRWGLLPLQLVLDAGRPGAPPGVCAGSGGVGRRAARQRVGEHWWPRDRVVPARAARSVCAELPRQPTLCARSEPHTCAADRWRAAAHRQPAIACRATRFQQPQVRACGDGGPDRRVHAAPASRSRSPHSARTP